MTLLSKAITFALLIIISVNATAQDFLANADRMNARIQALGEFGENPEGGVSRVAFSDADLAGRAYIRELMEDVGLEVRVDAAGNLIGRRSGSRNSLPPILIGSHTDSVPGGGNFDGQVGVVGALEVIEILNETGIETRHPIEVVSFTDEEGGLSGSRAMIGKLSEEGLDVVSHSGLSIRDGIRRVGGDPDRLDEAVLRPGDLTAYVELHIEQGAILYEEGIDIGVVEGIVGIRWWDVTVEGIANHAGTTPMRRRTDAMVTAAEITLAVNRIATDMEGRQVATVGQIQAFPGAPNVVPGRVQLSLEIRDLDSDRMQEVFDQISAAAEQIAEYRGTTISFEEIDLSAPPAPTDVVMRDIIERSANYLGLSNQRMPSGAGHDAQDIAQIAPVGMIFVPSVDGISHSPYEFTSPQDMANGASVLFRTVIAVDGGALDLGSRR